ncbi:MAG: tRNA uridine-5-carboxymethylaminomethyl(34) synthesis enzyme MnmG [Anaerolineae bacterium]
MSFNTRDYASYEVIVVGAGHAGCETALAAARMGRKTLLLTMNLDLLAHMPCNPSIGGSAKGQLVREIDALGGEMARITDRTFIQIRMLNYSRGPAVQAPRAQADKRLYALAMKHVLESTPNLNLKQGSVEELLTQGDRITGVRLATGEAFSALAVVLTTGTFLNARIMSGTFSTPAGRAGEFPSNGLARSLRELGLLVGRLQTNTPPRIDACSIDFALTQPQYGSEEPLYFSYVSPPADTLSLPIHPVYPIAHQTAWRTQMPCYLVRTNARTHQIIRDNLHRSPIAPGVLESPGPRYCPSIEEKIVRFPDKESHQLFLEPEGFATGEVYVQGCFTGLPVEVQLDLLRSIPALAQVEIMRPGYAIEYDYVPSHQLRPSLETRAIHGLFHGGQINGTSGYEEAAAQGLMAGINAALYVRDEEPLVLGRDEAYIGVLIDDLITKDIDEPYRMLTSRAEYRLLLRGDNADLRLTSTGHHLGLVAEERWQAVEAKRQAIEAEIARLGAIALQPSPALNAALQELGHEPLQSSLPARQLLRRPQIPYDIVAHFAPADPPPTPQVIEQVVTELQYEGYIEQQRKQVERARRLEGQRIPDGIDYGAIAGLRREARERLNAHRPTTVGQAARLAGVNPADIAALLVALQHRARPTMRS